MLLATLLAALAPQGVDRDLAAVLDAESRRIEVMAAAEPAVCSVMKRGSPGGGSGVLFDPRGFVLTNFHVVGKIEVKRMLVGLPDGVLYEATVLGMLGVVSLGYYIQQARGKMFYDEMLLLILLGAGIVIASDLLSALARRYLRTAS